MVEERKPAAGPQPEPGERRLPDLAFKPDERTAARVTRVRTAALVGTAVIIALGFIIIVSYRPKVQMPTGQHAAIPDAALAESTSLRLYDTAAMPPSPAGRSASTLVTARAATAAIDTLRGLAVEKWVRAGELLPTGPLSKDNGEEVAARLHRAVILCDSANAEIGAARQQAERVRQAARDDESGVSYRLSALYVAVSRCVELLAADATDRALFYSMSEAAVKATLVGDDADAEIKQNAATSYLRKSEDRQRAIGRQEKAVREALAGLDARGGR
jgi:hypothetical protein